MTVLGRTYDRRLLPGALVLGVVIVVGLYVVKWNPYFYKALDAASSHSVGDPIAGEAPRAHRSVPRSATPRPTSSPCGRLWSLACS
jgi:hypothetical protein